VVCCFCSSGSEKFISQGTVIVCCFQLCSDAVDLGNDTVAVDSLSLDTDAVDSSSYGSRTQMNPDVVTSILTPISPGPLSRSSELPATKSHTHNKYDVVVNGARSTTAPSIVLPASFSTVPAMSRAGRLSMASQQRPKSLDQEFTLLNLDIPNVTIHSVCFCFRFHFHSILVGTL